MDQTSDKTPRAKKLSLLFLTLLTIVALYFSWVIARPFVSSIVTAAVIAIAIYPLFVRLNRQVRNPNLASLLITLIVFVAILTPPIFVVNTVAREIGELYRSMNERVSWNDYLIGLVDRPIGWVAEKTGMSQDELHQAMMERLRNLGAFLFQSTKSLVVNVGAIIVGIFMTLLTLFFLLRDGDALRAGLAAMLPIERNRFEELAEVVSESIKANVYGVFAVAAAQGLLGAIGYTIAGLPSVVLWSAATAAFSMVPMVGTACVWVSACIYLAAIGSWGKAIFMLVWGAGVISTADNIVRPMVLSGRVKLNTLLIFFSLLGGVRAFGVIGLFTGPIIISVAIALLKMLSDERAGWEQGGANETASDLAQHH